MTKKITLRDLKQRTHSNAYQAFQLDWMMLDESSYSTFIELVHRGIDLVAALIARNPEVLQDASEDQITIQIVQQLTTLGMIAAHEQKTGGHCDLTVSWREMMWLGEAKKIDSMNNYYLYQGFLQLNSRYSTGAPNENAGGILIYCYCSRTDEILDSWKAYLGEKEQANDIQFADCKQNELAIISNHQHSRTGQRYYIRHLPISLYFQPSR